MVSAAPVPAAVVFHTGFDACWVDTTADLFGWSAGSGLPTVSTSIDVTANNRCALTFAPTASTALYRRTPTFTATDTAYATIRFKCSAIPATPLPLLTFYNSTSSKRGATLWIGPAATDATKFQLTAYYKDRGASCTASHTMDGTPCGGSCATVADCVPGGGVGDDVLACTDNVCVHECDETAQGEASCAPFYNASSPLTGYALNTYYLATLGHAKGTGAVTVSLWGGVAGATPASYALGANAHREGTCTGGANAGYACATNSDCASGACDTSDVIQVNSVIVGSDITSVADTYSCTIDELWVENSGPNPNGAIQTLALSGQGSTGNWSSVGSAHSCGAGTEYQCLNDATSPDSDTSTLTNTFAAQPTIGLVVANAATPTAPLPSPTPLAVTVESIAKNHAASGTSTVAFNITDDTGTRSGSAFAFSGFSDSGASALYHQMTPITLATRANGSAWTHASIDALGIEMRKSATSDAVRVSTVGASVLYDVADPAVPDTLTDRDSDGEITVCLAGDSTWADAVFAQNVASGLVQPANVLICALGGTTIGDLAYDLDDILHGRTSQYMRCLNYKGSTGKQCDVLLVGPGANNFRQGNYSDPANSSALSGYGQSGYCDMKGGSGDGASCSCPINSAVRHKDGASIRYWRLRNQYWKQPSFACASSEARCFANADCGANGVCTGGVCQTQLAYLVSGCAVGSGGILDQCVPGCLGAPGCPHGLCVSNASDAYDFQQMQDLVTRAEAYSWHPKVVVATAPPPVEGFTQIACWAQSQAKVGAYNRRLLSWARTTGRNYVDLAARQRRDCPTLAKACGSNPCSTTETATLCLRDAIHRTTLGNAISAQGLLDCLTAEGGTHDGACAAGICTAGRRKDACTTDADCDTWSCDFDAP